MVIQNNNILEMSNVGLRYDGGPEIFSDIKLNLKRGSFHFLTGKSGAGKTSLLSLMYLANKPSRGSITLFGRNTFVTDRDSLAVLRRRIGVVFQDFHLIEHLSAFDNVALPLRVCGMSEKEIKKRVTELLHWVELKRNMYAKVSTLSGGEKQRIAIARAVINRPDLLLADEPTGSVDNDIAPKLMKLFVELNKLGTTVVIATHNEEIINQYYFPVLNLTGGGLQTIYKDFVSQGEAYE